MFFTIDKQKIEIESYCRKFPPAPRSAVRCPALAAKVKPSPAVSYFFTIPLADFPIHPPRGPWEFPVGFPVVPSGFPRFFSGKPHRFPAIFPADAPKRQEKFPQGFHPSICRFHPMDGSAAGCNHMVLPVLLFINFNKTAPVSFQNFVGFSRISTVPHGIPLQLPSYTLYDLLDFHLRCHAFCQFAAVAVFIAGTVHHSFLDFCWIFFRSNGAVQRFFSCGCVPFSRRFYGKKFPFQIQSPKLVFVRRTFLSPFHPVSVVMSYPTCENHRFFR